MRAIDLCSVAAASAALTLAGCSTLPGGPSLQALPGSQKSPAQFAADDSRCLGFANEFVAGPTPTAAANQSVAAGAAAGTAIGAVTGAVIDGSSGAVAGAGLGLVLGALVGSSEAQGTWGGTQQQFDRVYYACMYALGHKVPVPANDVARYRAWFESAAPRPQSPPPPD